MVAATLATIHNEYYIINLVERMRIAIEAGNFLEFKKEYLARYKN